MILKKIFGQLRASFYFHVVRTFFSYRPKTNDKIIYLTFDDGPELGITEFILDELAKYNAKATFFCCGKNMLKNNMLVYRIIDEGHIVANHTFSHINGLLTSVDEYVKDVLKVDRVHPTALFRPPWGQMNFREYAKLIKKKVVLWDVESGDVTEGGYDKRAIIKMWKQKVKSGAIVLFHFSDEHAGRTKDLLPDFLKIFSEEGYLFDSIH